MLHIFQGLITEHAVFCAAATVTKKILNRSRLPGTTWLDCGSCFFHFNTNWLETLNLPLVWMWKWDGWSFMTYKLYSHHLPDNIQDQAPGRPQVRKGLTGNGQTVKENEKKSSFIWSVLGFFLSFWQGKMFSQREQQSFLDLVYMDFISMHATMFSQSYSDLILIPLEYNSYCSLRFGWERWLATERSSSYNHTFSNSSSKLWKMV